MLMATRTTWRTAALLEVAAMVVVLLSYSWVWRGAFAGAALLMLVLYFGLGFKSHLRSGETPRQLGFRTDNLVRALVNAATFVVPAIVVLLAIGLALESWHFNSWSRVLEGAPFMLVWATAQQYGLLCFFYRRFLEI